MSILATVIRAADKYEKLDVETELRLLAEYKAGNRAAVERLVMPNCRGILKIAHKHAGMGVGLDDLFMEGYQAFIRNIEKYDVEKGEKCRLFSVMRGYIGNAMKDAISKTSAVGSSRKVKKQYDVSLNERIDNGEGDCKERMDFIPDEDDNLKKEFHREFQDFAVETAEKVLSEKELYVVKAVVMYRQTLENAAKELKCTKQYVQIIKDKAIAKLRKEMRKEI